MFLTSLSFCRTSPSDLTRHMLALLLLPTPRHSLSHTRPLSLSYLPHVPSSGLPAAHQKPLLCLPTGTSLPRATSLSHMSLPPSSPTYLRLSSSSFF